MAFLYIEGGQAKIRKQMNWWCALIVLTANNKAQSDLAFSKINNQSFGTADILNCDLNDTRVKLQMRG